MLNLQKSFRLLIVNYSADDASSAGEIKIYFATANILKRPLLLYYINENRISKFFIRIQSRDNLPFIGFIFFENPYFSQKFVNKHENNDVVLFILLFNFLTFLFLFTSIYLYIYTTPFNYIFFLNYPLPTTTLIRD